jgi:hypothetical protein
VRVGERGQQLADVVRTLGGDHAELGHVGAQ